jgi:hypothetical protein
MEAIWHVELKLEQRIRLAQALVDRRANKMLND